MTRPYSPIPTPTDFFFVFPGEKSPQREMFCQCGKGQIKSGRSTKTHQNRQVQKLFLAVGKMCG